jgi:cold shock CspA family protein
MPKGKVKKIGPDQKFGFILPEDNSPDVFFHPKSFPEEVRHEGVEVEFELDPTPPQPGKQRRATKVTLADLSPSPVASPSGLGVKWEKFGHLRKVKIPIGEDSVMTEKLQFPIWLQLLYGKEPAPGIEVALDLDNVPIADPHSAYTDTEGKVSFVAYLDLDATDCRLRATVNDKPYTYFWENPNAPKTKPEESTAETGVQTASQELQVAKSRPDSHGIYVFTIPTKAGDQVSIHGKRQFEVEARADSYDPWATGPFTATDDTMKLEVRGKTEGTLGDIIFEISGLKSRPRFIERPKPNSGAHHHG